jgi:hypothetical protein
MSEDKDCICQGNWRAIIKEHEPLLGKKFEYNDSYGTYHTFVGVLHGDDDYYYVMYEIVSERCKFLSCVGSLKSHGYTLVKE